MTGYQRQLGTLDVIMIVAGAMIGGGIFLAPPGVARQAGSAGVTLAVWVLGGVITIAGGFCFAELGARMPHAGGSYVYLREGYGPVAAFVQGWSLMVVSGAGSVAAVSAFCASQVGKLSGAPESSWPCIAAGLILLLAGINCVGLRPGATTQNVLTALKMLLLGLVTYAGFKVAAAAGAAAGAGTGTGVAATAWGGLLGSLVPVIFAYNGWQVIGFVAGEIDDPPRRLPRAMATGILTVTVLYLLVNASYLSALGVAGLASAGYPGGTVMERAFGPLGGTLITLGTIVSTLGFVNVSILTLPRMMQAMAADGLFLSSFGEVHPRFHTPVRAILLQAGWAVALVFWGKSEELLAYVVIADGFFMGLSAAALFALRGREKPEETAAQGYLSPGYPALPALYVLASVGVMASAVASKPDKALAGAGLILLGLPLYWLWIKLRPRHPVA